MRAVEVAAANSFQAVADEWVAKFSPDWADSHTAKLRLRLNNDLLPWLGAQPIAEIEADDLLVVLRRIEARGVLETAHRCLGYCSQIFRYAIATSRAKRNPAADLRGALPPAKGGHFASIVEPEGVSQLLRAIDGYQVGLVSRLALRLAPLTLANGNRPSIKIEVFDPKAEAFHQA